MLQTRVRNAANTDFIVLNDREEAIVNMLQKHVNALGFEIDITTMTGIQAQVTEQQFYDVAIADYFPVKVGNQPWSTNLLTYRSYQLGDDFSKGVVNAGGGNARLASASAGVDSVSVAVRTWATEIGWTLAEMEQAQRAGNWDLIRALEVSRKTNWDLGIQRLGFLGGKGDTSVLGLLNQSSPVANTSLITGAISNMSTVDLKTFCAGVIGAYRTQNKFTAWPDRFVVPETDYTGMAAQASADFPIKSVLVLLEEMFQSITMNKNFKVLPSAYADSVNSGFSYQIYALYRANEGSIRLDIPVDYTATAANTANSFQYFSTAYGQYTGVGLYRPLELMYFTYNV